MKAQIVIEFPNDELKEKYMNQKLVVTLFGRDGAIKVEGEMKPLYEDVREKDKSVRKFVSVEMEKKR